MDRLQWQKAYKGPFDLEEAQQLVAGLIQAANPAENGIYSARVRRRKGQRGQYDVFIQRERPFGQSLSTATENNKVV